MKTIIYTSLFLAISIVAFSQTTAQKKINTKIINEKDPICGMKTADYLKDTLAYNKKIYGFCSTYCKLEFKKNPQKYLRNSKNSK